MRTPKSLPPAPCSRIIIRPLSRFRLFILTLIFDFGCKINHNLWNKQTIRNFFIEKSFILLLSPTFGGIIVYQFFIFLHNFITISIANIENLFVTLHPKSCK